MTSLDKAIRKLRSVRSNGTELRFVYEAGPCGYEIFRDEGIQQARKGNCYDNAPMESFWGAIKNEQIHHCRYATRQEAIQDVTEYIEIFYNRQRRQARLRFLSPASFEQWFYEKRLAA